MDYLDKIMDEQAAYNDAIMEHQEKITKPKPAPPPEPPRVDTFAFVGLFRSEIGWCRMLADSERRQIKLERLIE